MEMVYRVGCFEVLDLLCVGRWVVNGFREEEL